MRRVPAFGSINAVKYVSACYGILVPGLEIFWPDPAISQLNHVSDLGYQTNKVFPKDSADVVYGFFPLDRILTPTLKKVFLSTPALFMYPAELFVDDQIGSKSCAFKRYCAKKSDIKAVRGKFFTMVKSSQPKGTEMNSDDALRLLALPFTLKYGSMQRSRYQGCQPFAQGVARHRHE